jgi:NAD(P)-dependent dehydrogenase (short-subunit alcohol dehydrogenase family)
MRLAGKSALVTGSSRGIGKAIALGLAREGADVAVNYAKSRDAAEQVVQAIRELGRQATCIQADVSQKEQVFRLAEESWKTLGKIDILVNNAGTASLEPFDHTTEDSWNRTLDTNLKGPFFCAQQIAVKMIEAGIRGRIINVSSTNGTMAEALLASYNASKGGLELVTKSLAIELAPYGITSNGIAPGLIQTEIGEDFDLDPKFFEYCVEHIPLGRMGSIEDCVGATVFLASDESAYITGHTVVIDGGLTCDQMPRLQFYKPQQ